MTSTRLPGKVLLNILEQPVLELMIERVRRISGIDDIIIATTTNSSDNPIVELGNRLGGNVWRGSEMDVLGRVVEAAKAFDVDVIVEITGDCPLIDSDTIDNSIDAYKNENVDCVSNAFVPTYPLGMDHYVVSTNLLIESIANSGDPLDHEHVIRYVLRHPDIYRLLNLPALPKHRHPNLMLTLDYKEDFKLIKIVFEKLYPKRSEFNLDDILFLFKKEPQLAQINAHVRNPRA